MQYIFSPDAAELIAKFEGYRSKPYLDIVKVPTIGFGTTTYPTGKKVTMKDSSINKEIALEMLMYHLNKIMLPDLNKHITREDLTQAQIDAIGCLVYNIGDGGFDKSNLLKKINANASLEDIRSNWLAWDKAKEEVIPDLVARRQAEFKHYIS